MSVHCIRMQADITQCNSSTSITPYRWWALRILGSTSTTSETISIIQIWTGITISIIPVCKGIRSVISSSIRNHKSKTDIKKQNARSEQHWQHEQYEEARQSPVGICMLTASPVEALASIPHSSVCPWQEHKIKDGSRRIITLSILASMRSTILTSCGVSFAYMVQHASGIAKGSVGMPTRLGTSSLQTKQGYCITRFGGTEYLDGMDKM